MWIVRNFQYQICFFYQKNTLFIVANIHKKDVLAAA